MKLPTKKSVRRIMIYLATMIITYLIINLIFKGSFSNIEWDVIVVMCSVSFITLLILSDKEERNKKDK